MKVLLCSHDKAIVADNLERNIHHFKMNKIENAQLCSYFALCVYRIKGESKISQKKYTKKDDFNITVFHIFFL